MGLRGQQSSRGYAMAALLVMLGVMAVLMTAALPAWRFQAKREKELDLVFRGEQYARAILLYQLKNNGVPPPNIDTLVTGRYLRKKYKDPMTKDGEFQPLIAGAPVAPGTPGAPGAPPAGPRPAGPQAAGLIGVVSKSKESSIITYNGRTKYNEWQFLAANVRDGLRNPAAGGMGGVPPGQRQPGMPNPNTGRGNFPGPGRGTAPGMPPGRGPVGFPPGGGRGPGRGFGPG